MNSDDDAEYYSEDEDDADLQLAEQSNVFGEVESYLRDTSTNNLNQRFSAAKLDELIDGDAVAMTSADNLIVSSCLQDGFFTLQSHMFSSDTASVSIRTSNIMGDVTPLALQWCGRG